MKGRRIASLALLLGGLALLQLSCSLLLQAGECDEDNDDCPGGLVCGDEGLCVSLLNDQCREMLGEVNDGDALLLGALLPLSGESLESGFYLKRAIQLAVDEINLREGVQGSQGGRKLAVLVCDDEGSVDVGLAGARHLAEVAGVPAIIGSAFSFVTLPVAEQVTIGAGTLLVSPASTAVDISGLDDNNLVWRTVPPDSVQADTMAYFATWEVLQSAGIGADGQFSQPAASVNVGLVYPDDSYGKGLKNNFQNVLLGKVEAQLPQGFPLGESGLQLLFHSHPYSLDDLDDDALNVLVGEISSAELDLVMLAGYDESADLFEALQPVLSAAGTSYFLSDGMRSDFLTTALPNDGQGKPRLLFGTNPGGRLDGDAAWEGFRDRYLARWSDEVGAESLHNYVENAYDATYLLAYALSSTSADLPTGAALATGLSQLAGNSQGPSVSIGPSDVLVAFREIDSGNRLNLQGASGPIAFDPAGDPISGSMIRWDLRWDSSSSNWQIDECGVASSYDITGAPTRHWCSAYCVNTATCADDCPGPEDCDPECVPVHEEEDGFGDDDDSSSVSDDDDTGDDDDSTPIDCSPGDDDDASPGTEGNNLMSFPDRGDCADGLDNDVDQCVDCDDTRCGDYKVFIEGDDDDSAGGHLPSCQPAVMGN